MKGFFISLLIAGAPSILAHAQAGTTLTDNSVKVEKSKPTVYLSAERGPNEKVRIRMHNNTTWAIAVLTTAVYLDRKQGAELKTGHSLYLRCPTMRILIHSITSSRRRWPPGFDKLRQSRAIQTRRLSHGFRREDLSPSLSRLGRSERTQ